MLDWRSKIVVLAAGLEDTRHKNLMRWCFEKKKRKKKQEKKAWKEEMGKVIKTVLLLSFFCLKNEFENQ